MNDRVKERGRAALAPRVQRGLQTSAILIALAAALTACGGGGTNDSPAGTESPQASTPPPTGSVNPHVVPLSATYRGKTYSQWAVSFWQWGMALPVNNPSLPHPFNDCTRPISAGQTGNVWYWSAPDIPNEICNQSATIIPAGTSIFLSTLDDEASSLDASPFQAPDAAGQLAIAQQFANYIQDLFVKIDDVPVTNVIAYRTTTGQFPFTAPTPWIFNTVGGNGTAVADGYFLLLEPLPAGPHTIHYGGKFHIPAGVLGPDPVDIVKDTTLLITMGG